MWMLRAQNDTNIASTHQARRGGGLVVTQYLNVLGEDRRSVCKFSQFSSEFPLTDSTM